MWESHRFLNHMRNHIWYMSIYLFVGLLFWDLIVANVRVFLFNKFRLALKLFMWSNMFIMKDLFHHRHFQQKNVHYRTKSYQLVYFITCAHHVFIRSRENKNQILPMPMEKVFGPSVRVSICQTPVTVQLSYRNDYQWGRWGRDWEDCALTIHFATKMTTNSTDEARPLTVDIAQTSV